MELWVAIVMLLYNCWVCYYIDFVFCAIICGLLWVVFAYYSCIAMGCYGPGFLHPNHHTQHLQNIGQTMDMQLGAPCKSTMDMGATRKCKLIYFGHFMQACNSFSSWNHRHAYKQLTFSFSASKNDPSQNLVQEKGQKKQVTF